VRLSFPHRTRQVGWLAVPLSLVLFVQNAVCQQPRRAEPEPEIVELGPLKGAAAPDPALKYSFSDFAEPQIPENAAVHYLRAMRRFFANRRQQQENDAWETEWLSLQPNELSDVPVGTFLDSQDNVFDSLDRASRCSHCDWHLMPEGDVNFQQMISVNLDDIQEMRSLARLLQLRLRYAISQGEWEKASETARILFRMGYDLQEFPLLISGLVGAAIQGITYGELAYWIAEPNSPNLYWALQTLPHPKTDLSKGMGGELAMILRGIRALDDPEKRSWSAEQWIQSLTEDLAAVAPMSGTDLESPTVSRLAVSAMIIRGYPIAKKALLARGYTAEQLDSMPSAQVVCIHQSIVARRYFHDIIKWRLLDTPEARRRMVEQEQESRKILRPDSLDGFTLQIIPMVIPAFRMIAQAETRLRRTHEALSTLEALRLHVAATGHAPQSLEAILEVPVPMDSQTGRPLHYEKTADAVSLRIKDYLVTGQDRIYRWTFPQPQ
jgi:hypothetical protein